MPTKYVKLQIQIERIKGNQHFPDYGRILDNIPHQFSFICQLNQHDFMPFHLVRV